MAILSIIASRRLWLLGAVATRLGAQQPAPIQQAKDTATHDSTPATLIGHVVDTRGVIRTPEEHVVGLSRRRRRTDAAPRLVAARVA